jgi:hypothetical protein
MLRNLWKSHPAKDSSWIPGSTHYGVLVSPLTRCEAACSLIGSPQKLEEGPGRSKAALEETASQLLRSG